MGNVNFLEVTDANGNRRLINIQNIKLVEEYQKPDYNVIYLDVYDGSNAPIIMYVQNDYTSIVEAISNVLTDPPATAG